MYLSCRIISLGPPKKEVNYFKKSFRYSQRQLKENIVLFDWLFYSEPYYYTVYIKCIVIEGGYEHLISPHIGW